MEPQFEELAKRITDDVTKRVSDEVTKQIGASEDRIAERVLKTVTSNVVTIVEKAKDELKNQAKINVEEVKQQATTIAQNYGGVLDGIHRQLQDLNSKVDVKFRDHDLILANHNSRITKLEKR